MTKPLVVTRAQILAFRRKVSALDERLPMSPRSLERAASAGLQDSMPRAALLSIHARVKGTTSSSWEHASLVQLWGPRFSTYVVAKRDIALFTVSRLPDDERRRRRADEIAARARAFLAGRRMPHSDVEHALHGANGNVLRYAAPTGTIVIRWEGARQPTVWNVPAPTIAPREARIELARRYLHIFGPSTPSSFAAWAGISDAMGRSAFEALERSLTAVRTPIGDAWILSGDEDAMRSARGPAAPARLLPSGDTYFLLRGRERELLVPDAKRRAALWTSRVWPGAALVKGEIVGTWRRDGGELVTGSWRALSRAERDAVEAEAHSLPLPDLAGRMRVRWL